MNAQHTNADLFASLHNRATEAFGASRVGEYVTEIPGFPWFAVTLGDKALVAEYDEAADTFALKTFEHEYLVSRDGHEGALMVWGELRDAMEDRLGPTISEKSSIYGVRLTQEEERRLLTRLGVNLSTAWRHPQ
ncbi:conserved hypothetical protein [Burkholderia gladioli]|uniref:hypothetical protein n=1 Tax=Burkholderia gladioli TaxID=28095 RepID=UPI001CB42850|nr:hypothetical protein [Burkholderia gladioli]CAG9233838.1 conserved hypothetical protein [Burkholderia gladioli]